MRADKYFSERFGSRTKAAEALEKGLILRNGKPLKPKSEVEDGEEFTFLTVEESYVSNGGYKLSRAISAFGFSPKNAVCADIGASTGGFTDCLLQNGAKRVYAVDVGESLLHPSLRSDSRVVALENVNARYLRKSDFPEKLDIVVSDVSFISLRLILPVISGILEQDGIAFVLIKPQFECEKKNIGKSGIVHTEAHVGIVRRVLGYCREAGLYPFGIVNAPVRKGKNLEYVLYLKKTAFFARSDKEIVECVASFVKSCSLGELE